MLVLGRVCTMLTTHPLGVPLLVLQRPDISGSILTLINSRSEDLRGRSNVILRRFYHPD